MYTECKSRQKRLPAHTLNVKGQHAETILPLNLIERNK